MASTTIMLIAGILLLLLGRKLFWLFVGAVGFIAGMHFAQLYLHGQPESVVLTIALVCGAIGIVLAIVVQKVAVILAGFAGGGYLAWNLMEALGITVAGQAAWIPFVIGGIIGAVILSILFGWALIALSSLVGALLVVQALHLHSTIALVVLIALCVIGIMVQSSLLRGSVPRSAGRD